MIGLVKIARDRLVVEIGKRQRSNTTMGNKRNVAVWRLLAYSLQCTDNPLLRVPRGFPAFDAFIRLGKKRIDKIPETWRSHKAGCAAIILAEGFNFSKAKAKATR